MSELIKRQHYVWRNYLRAWADGESIYTLFKTQKEIRKTALMGVAQEKYFYELPELTVVEEAKLKTFINHFSNPDNQDLSNDFFNLFTAHNSIIRNFDPSKSTEEEKKVFEKEVRKIKVNSMEKLHGHIESLGDKLLNIASCDDLDSLTEDEIYYSIIFLCFQFIRTKPRQKAIEKEINGHQIADFSKKVWNILTFTLAFNMARAISIHKDRKIVLLKNNTDLNFITGDQPSFNIDTSLNEESLPKVLELYYPISPKLALIVNINSSLDQFLEKEISIDEVNTYNLKLLENSNFFVFGTDKDQLEIYNDA